MNKQIIKETSETPLITMDFDNGTFEISGRSFANNANVFYQPIIDSCKDYSFNPASSTIMIFKLEYFNSIAQKYFAELIKILKDLPSFSVRWYYESDDEDLLSLGKKYEKLFNLRMEFIEY